MDILGSMPRHIACVISDINYNLLCSKFTLTTAVSVWCMRSGDTYLFYKLKTVSEVIKVH